MTMSLPQLRQSGTGDGWPLSQLQRRVSAQGPPDAQGVEQLAQQLGMPAAAVRGALSFYDDLHAPPGATRVCQGTSCMLAGAEALGEALSGHHVCTSVHCLGYCDRSPAVMRPDGAVVAPCSLGGAGTSGAALAGAAEATAMPTVRCMARQPIVTQRIGQGDHASLAKARQAGVYDGLKQALTMTPGQVIEHVEQSGERGRGGAGFPTAAKWRLCADTPSDMRYVIANGDEGDPGSFIDRLLMEFDPHAVLEGMAICAHAVGASRGVVFIRSEYRRAIQVMRAAVDAARQSGLLGAEAPGSGRAFDVQVAAGLGSYVCGEETALLNALEGRRGEVRLRPPYPAQQGLFGRPTVVNNVETLVNVAWIVRHDPQAYRALGTEASPGTKAICLNHGFARPGVVEVAFGTPLRAVIDLEAGGGRDGAALDAVLLGGPMGSLLTEDEWDVPICYDAMRRAGAELGHGGLVALPRGTDYGALLLHLLQFMQHESCGKCVPCAVGSQRALELAQQAIADGGEPGARQLRRLLDVIAEASLCAFGQLTPAPLRKIIDTFGASIFPKVQHA